MDPHITEDPTRNVSHEPPGNTRLDAAIVSLEVWSDQLGISHKAVLTTAEAAEVLRISERSLRDGLSEGSIPCVRIGHRVLIPVPMLLRSLLREPSAG